MTQSTTRTPQPGDVWEDGDGTRYFVANPLTDRDQPFFFVQDGKNDYMLDIDDVKHVLTEHIDKQGWRYLGRASDLIAAGIAALGDPS